MGIIQSVLVRRHSTSLKRMNSKTMGIISTPSGSKPFLEAIKNRRTIYTISPHSTISDDKIKEIVSEVVYHCPSPFNVQSARAVILLGSENHKLWDITRDTYKAAVPPPVYNFLDGKITGFRNGYGTVLWFEDPTAWKAIEEKMGDRWAGVKDKCPQWAEHASGIHQFSVWTAFEAEGLGCSLQHYNPLIDDHVKEEFGIPKEWSLKAQLVFGTPTAPACDKTFKAIDDRVIVHSS